MLVGILIIFLVGAIGVALTSPKPREGSAEPFQPSDAEPPYDPIALANSDPIEALRLYGTPETAEQLRAQGVDLAALGYRDGGEA